MLKLLRNLCQSSSHSFSVQLHSEMRYRNISNFVKLDTIHSNSGLEEMKTNIDGGSNAIFLFLLSKIFLNQLWIMLVSRYNFTYLHYKFEIKKEKYGLCSQKRVYFAFSFDEILLTKEHQIV